MRKIKGFKLNLRSKEIQRRAKKAGVNLAALGLDGEPSLDGLMQEFASHVQASVLFDSIPSESPSALSPVPGLAHSVALATLGAETDDYVQSTVVRTPSLGPLLGVVAKTALEDASRFVLGLIEEEAKADHCELSPIQLLTEPAILSAAIDRLAGHKIGITADGGTLRPAHSVAFSVSWLSRSRSRSKSA